MRETPHLVSASTVIQFGDWNRTGYEYMAKKYLEQNRNELMASSDEMVDAIDETIEIENMEAVVLC